MPAYRNKDNGTWYCKFNYTNWKGEKKTKLKRGFRTKKEALEWERQFQMEECADMDMEFEAFVEVYFNDKKGRLKERTVMTKRIMIEKKILPFFGKKRMNEIKPADIMKWQNEMLAMEYKDTYLRISKSR